MARLLGIVAGAAAAIPLCASQAADKPPVAPQTAVGRLLELGDRYSPDAVTNVRAYYAGLDANSADDGRVQYALALVLIRQHGHKEAVEFLDKIVAREPDALHLWRATIWAKMAAHQDREALADIRSVADVLARQSPAALPASEAESWRTTAEFLARVFGFLEIPRPGALPAEELRSAKQYVLAALGDEQAEFNQNQEAVAEKFSKARAASEDLRTKRVAERVTKQAEYGKQKKIVDEAETNVDFDTEKVKSNTKTEVERLNPVIESLQKYLLAGQFRLNVVRQAILDNQDKLYQQALASELTASGVTSGRVTLVRQAQNFTAIKNLIQRLAAEEIVLSQQVNEWTRQLQTAVAQRDFSLNHAEMTTAELRTQAAALAREERRLERAQQTEGQKITVERHKTLLTKQTSFASFEPFPFDVEKQRVLGTVDP